MKKRKKKLFFDNYQKIKGGISWKWYISIMAFVGIILSFLLHP
jgi:hypothetical protein